MSIKEIKSGTLYKEYSIEIPYEEINEIIDNKIKEILPTVSLPGFRKGKAPVNIVRKKYENNVLSEAVESLVQTKTKNLLEEKNLKPFTQPKVNLKKYEKNQPIQVEIKVDLEPEINLKDFSKIKVNSYKIKLDKPTIENNYKNFIRSQKNYKEISNKRELKKTDKVYINLSTNNEEAPEYLKNQKNLPLVIDSEYQFLPGIGEKLFEKKLKKGEKINLSFDISKSLKLDKEKLVDFNIELLKIEELVPFIVDKEFLDKNGLKDEDELKKNLQTSLNSQYENGIKQIEKKELMDILNKEHSFDLPEGIIEQEFNDIWHRLSHAKKDGTLDEDDKKLNDNELKKRYQKISQRRVKLAILLQFIAKKNNIGVSEKELSSGIMQYASQYPGQEKQIIEYFKSNPSTLETVRGPILEQKVIDHVKLQVNKTDLNLTKSDYEKLEKKVFDIKKES